MKSLKILIFFALPLLLIPLLTTDTYSQKTGEEEMKKEPLVLVINYPYQIYSNDPTKIHVTLFKPDFTPAKGAKVVVNKKDVGKADKNGVCIFDYVPGSNESHVLVATLKEKGKTYEIVKSFSCNSRTVSFKADRLFVYTDRGVYNPGQDILIRIIAWQLKGEYAPVPNAKVQLLLQDQNGKVFSGEYVESNEFGVAATKLSLPDNMPEGDYELVVLYEKARESASIRVKRFVPPVINITHDFKRYLTDTQEKLEAKVELGYFAGGKIKSSTLTLSILSYDNTELFSKKLSSEKPVYHISLTKKELQEIQSKLTLETDYRIKIVATDSYGQTDEVIWDFTYTARPYSAVLEVDKDSYPKGEKVQILAKVVDIDGQPAKHIPLYLEIQELELKKEAKTDDKGVAVLEFTMPDFTVYAYVKSPIMKDYLAYRTIPYQPLKPMVSKASEPPKGAGTKTTISVTFDKDYIPVEKVVHVDMTDISGALVVSTTIPVSKSKGTYVAKGKVTAPTWGTMLVNLYCCAVHKNNKEDKLSPETVGFITEGQHITFYPDKELEISVENFKPSVAPGEKVSFKVKVKGGKGEKCLGVAVVDDAVISLLDPFIKDPIQHFYNPQVKVISTGGAGVLTWPVVDRNWGSPWRDIAYTNWGWKAPGPFIAGAYDDTYKDDLNGGVEEAQGVYGYDNGDELLEEESAGEYEKSADLADAPAASPVTSKSAMKKAEAGAVDRIVEEGDGAPQKTIVIRTRFPETSLWEPLAVTKKGKAEFTFSIPDEITMQNLSIVATDKEGYIGFLRKDIKVTQPLFVRAAFPATMILGDRLKVHALVKNLSNKKVTCTAKLTSIDLEVIGNKKVKITIDKNETAVVEWLISGSHCGKNDFTVSCETDKFVDKEKKSVFILPTGEPKKQLVKGIIKGEGSWEAVFTTDKKATYRVANLNVSMPNVFPAIQAWWAFEVYPWYSPWTTAATAIMNTAVLDYAIQSKGDPKFIDLLKLKLSQASAQLTYQQFPSGAWGWYFLADATAPSSVPIVGGENLYYTVYVLRGLAEIKKADLPVDESVMLRAVDYIMKNRNKKGLWSSKGAYFWQVFNEETDNAFSAETFEVLMLTYSVLPSANKYDKEFTEIKDSMERILGSKLEEPMTIAAAVQGLSYWADIKKDHSLKKVIEKNIEYLITLKRKGYWEPHWYHAYGGMVELNARILELLADYDPQKYDAYLREGMTWLLATREAWGAWHNEIGTANAIRALLKTGAFAEEKESRIAMKVNGKTVAKIDIDPKDPFLSAAKLRYFEITPWIESGKNTVEVSYDGNLNASILLEIQEWGVGIPEIADIVSIERKAPSTANLGEPITVSLNLKSKEVIPVLTIEEYIPANSEVDIKSLEILKKEQKIADYILEGEKLYLVLVKVEGSVKLEYTLKATREGNGLHAGTRVIDASNGTLLASIVSTALTVN
jgi:uncharacterized protein YfaS (alpha-2-macroglobulin family)